MFNIQSNSIRGDYMRDIVDRTISEVHDVMVTIFGPYATDAFIKKDGQPYYTRDGKEVISSMRFDNELSIYVLQMLYQAVYRQAAKVGDGTTTLAVFYTNLYKAFRENTELMKCSISELRPIYNEIIKELNDDILKSAETLTETDLKSLIYTCTQDASLANMFYDKLKDAIMDEAYIIVSKSNIESEVGVTVHMNPILRVEKQFSLYNTPDDGKLNNVVMFYCNGMLDISAEETLYSLSNKQLATEDGSTISPNIALLCHGMTETTRKTIKSFAQNMKTISANNPDQKFNNLIIYTLVDYRKFDSAMIEDLVTFLYNEPGIGGIVNSLTFEHLIYQAFKSSEFNVDHLESFDADLAHLEKLRSLLVQPFSVTLDSIEGMKFEKELPTLSRARYNELRNEIDEEKSEVKKIELKKRLKLMYGQFIEVEVGSKLLKDSQRKYELILDAVVSSLEAVRHGAIKKNSLVQAFLTAYKKSFGYICDDVTTLKCKLSSCVMCALEDTINDMLYNRSADLKLDDYCDIFNEGDDWSFNLTRDDVTEIFSTAVKDDMIVTADGEIEPIIVEPATVITTLLEHSVTVLELATAKAFNLDSYMANNI